MDIVASIIKALFGSKADKDRKQIEPYLEKIKAVYPSIEKLTNDELRAHSEALKKQIADFIAADEARIVELKAILEKPETQLEEKEKISKEIDETTKRIDEKIEEVLDKILPEAFAIMKDTARRFAQNETVVVTANDFDRNLAATKDFVTIEGDKAVYATHWLAGGNDTKWDMIHYDVQLFGGVVLHQGKIAEMATGEGKTLVATLPVFLNALAKKGVHMVTVNNYLAKRDSEWMGPMYQFHGLSVACIDDTQPNSDARREAYMADITFGTNNEYGFDYLRDNMASSPKDLVQRKHHFAIVDEVDSVLIDDARTPLIISGPVPQARPPDVRAVPPGHRKPLQPAKEPRDGPAGRGAPADLGGQERRGRREALPRPQGSAEVQTADQIPLGTGRQGADAEDREHLHAGQQPPHARDHRRPLLRHRRETQLGGTHGQGPRGAVEILQRRRILRDARHRRRSRRTGEKQPDARGEGAETRRGDQRLLDQVGARAHGDPAAESLRHVRKGHRVCGDGQQGEDRRRADGPYPRSVRRYSDGLHQAIEAKEHVEVARPRRRPSPPSRRRTTSARTTSWAA